MIYKVISKGALENGIYCVTPRPKVKYLGKRA